jgi:hypothetical protein
MSRLRALWRDYGLSITLAALFLASWIAQAATQWVEVSNEAATHGQTATWHDYWPQFLSSTFENWQSEFLQLLSFVVLTAFLIHRGSHESKDGDEELKRIVLRIDRRLDALERRETGGDDVRSTG